MIQAENLTKTFGKIVAVDHMHCSIPEGCIYGMVGSNGAGKSTFLRLLTGVYKADEGTILIDGEPVYENPKIKGQIAYVSDDLFFLPGASLERMALLYKSLYPDFSEERFAYLMNTFKLPKNRPIHNFSKGMKRQASIILALSSCPKYMFFDETFDGLDPVMRNLVKSLICSDVAERNATAIITSHSLRELEDICDQLALLHKGGVVLENDITDLKTGLFKIQTAFPEEFSLQDFNAGECLYYQRTGSVVTMIVKGDREQVIEQIREKEPLLLDVLPLTLEEVFTYELQSLGYVFDTSGYGFIKEAEQKGEYHE